MRNLILWGVTALAAVAFVALALHLWRRLRAKRYRWGIGETFAALGLVVTVLLAVLPQLLASDDDSVDPAVTAYQEQVAATCRALIPATNPLLEAMGDGLELDRARLEQGLRNQLTGSYGVLQNFWNTVGPPESLADQAERARADGNALLAATSDALNAMANELPASIPMTKAIAWLGAMDARLRPPASAFEASMSELAGQPCRAPLNQAEPAN